MSKFPMDADILPPSDDRIFKTLLTHPDAKQVLIDVVSTVIDQIVTDAHVRNIEMPVMDTGEKSERFDVNCAIDNGDQVDVEMHCSKIEEAGREYSNFINKYIYYLTDLHSSQKSKGVKYSKLVRTYQVTFCTNTVFPAQVDYVSRFSLRTRDGRQLSDQINMVIIELSKLGDILRKPARKLTAFEMWAVFFGYASDPVHRNLINGIIDEKEEINMAAQLLQEVSQDERERAILRSRRMAETDRISDLLTAEERGEIRGLQQGIQQGIQQGREEGQEKVLALLKQGLSLEEIKQRLQ
ncbi:MAG: Rpn family recombination-promoting nuclease/putative transposase [Treponema sp.]|nr:Rpn family recombination-promoting nuclease/putative transposase [Treponema sp.]MCL2271925.1 Rpn family recombination-promoting nuclease/putative transposase [Treponema sp.]